MSKDTFYFSHDYNTRTDDKIKGLIRKHGMAGFGIFWAIVEDLYNNANALSLDYEGIAYDLRTDSKIIESIINDFDLFIIEDGFFGSESVGRRLEERNSKSKKARDSAFKRWSKDKLDSQRNANASKDDANAMRSECEGNTIKESIEKDNKEKDIMSFKNFWNTYDKDVDQEICESHWNSLTESERAACTEKLSAYIKSTPNRQFRKNPVNYLINKSWLNEIQSTQNTGDIPKEPNPREVVFKPPSVEEVAAYCSERKNGIDPIAFINHYETNGWRCGNGTGKPVINWKACVRTWEDNRRKEQEKLQTGTHPRHDGIVETVNINPIPSDAR